MNAQAKAHNQETAATAKLSLAKKTPEAIVNRTQQVAAVIKGTPHWQNASLQQSVTQWLGAADAVDKDDQAIKTARLNLAALIAQRAKHVTAWKRTTKSVLSDVNEVSAGSAQIITELGFLVDVRKPVPASTEAPTALRVRYTKALVLVVKWNAVKGARGYLVQIGDLAGQSFGPSIACVKSTFEPQGLAPGQKVTFRVAVQRKEGTSAWSDVLAVTVR
jgi:hypothetical protein